MATTDRMAVTLWQSHISPNSDTRISYPKSFDIPAGRFFPRPHAPGEPDLIIKKEALEYAVELKRAPESRRDRFVPLLVEAILQAQAYARKIPAVRPLAIIASPHLSPAVFDKALEFQQANASDVAVGFKKACDAWHANSNLSRHRYLRQTFRLR
jgi:hypothetical protein